jgi:molybdate transport system ATP-binding protein
LTIRGGDRLAILGKNGAGKSFLAQLLALRVNGDEALNIDSGSIAQLRDMGRYQFALGFNEMQNLEATRRAQLAVALPNEAPRPVYSATTTFISFESHRKLLRDELDEYEESRYSIVHKRATPASFLFPELYPLDTGGAMIGYRPRRTRLAPLPVPYDAEDDHPALATFEKAVSEDGVKKLLMQFGLFDIRHRPIYGLSTGEARKLMVVAFLLSKSRLLVLDESFEGLDERSQGEFKHAIASAFVSNYDQTVVNICHREDDLAAVLPTHALLLGQGERGSGWCCGNWNDMEASAKTFFIEQAAELNESAQRTIPNISTGGATNFETGAPIVDFREVTIAYQQCVVLNKLSWTIREGENWVIKGSNGSGKSTVLDLITGENLKAFQQNIWLFGKKKGSGESIWDIKRQLGTLSTSLHMAYNNYADPTHRGAGQNGGMAKITSFEVVCSGFFDSIGLYDKVTLEQEKAARAWVSRFGLDDIVEPHAYRDPAKGAPRTSQKFYALSHGQQKLVLLCRAMVKSPRLLLLDEPSHGLSGLNRERFLGVLRILAVDKAVAIVYVTHRQDELDALNFENVLELERL